MLVTFILCIGLRQSQLTNAIFPGAGLYGTSTDLTPIEMYFPFRSGTVTWRVPKAYLPFIPNWKGGNQSHIEIRAVFNWDSTEMLPLSTVKKVNGKPDADRQLFLEIGAGDNTARRDWELLRSSWIVAIGEEGDLIEYHYKQLPGAPPPLSDSIFVPKDQPPNLVYIRCPRNSLGDFLMCQARTDFSEKLLLKYNVSSRDLNRWQEIDARARVLVSGFLVSESAH